MGKNNLVLAAAVALLSYLPFKILAKMTLIMAALLFVLDPFPMARLVSIISILIMGVLNKLKEAWELGQEEEELVITEDETNIDNKTHAD